MTAGGAGGACRGSAGTPGGPGALLPGGPEWLGPDATSLRSLQGPGGCGQGKWALGAVRAVLNFTWAGRLCPAGGPPPAFAHGKCCLLSSGQVAADRRLATEGHVLVQTLDPLPRCRRCLGRVPSRLWPTWRETRHCTGCAACSCPGQLLPLSTHLLLLRSPGQSGGSWVLGASKLRCKVLCVP